MSVYPLLPSAAPSCWCSWRPPHPPGGALHPRPRLPHHHLLPPHHPQCHQDVHHILGKYQYIMIMLIFITQQIICCKVRSLFSSRQYSTTLAMSWRSTLGAPACSSFHSPTACSGGCTFTVLIEASCFVYKTRKKVLKSIHLFVSTVNNSFSSHSSCKCGLLQGTHEDKFRGVPLYYNGSYISKCNACIRNSGTTKKKQSHTSQPAIKSDKKVCHF